MHRLNQISSLFFGKDVKNQNPEPGRYPKYSEASSYETLPSSGSVKHEQRRICGPLAALTFNLVVAVGIIFMNKWVCVLNFVYVLKNVGFQFPVLLTVIHYGVSWALMATLKFFSILPASPSSLLTPSSLFAFGLVNSVSTGLANVSLKYNSVGFYQMAKIAITPLIVLAEFIWYKKRIAFSKVIALTVVSVGVAIATVADLQFSLFGENEDHSIDCENVSILIPTIQDKRIDETLEIEIGSYIHLIRVLEIGISDDVEISNQWGIKQNMKGGLNDQKEGIQMSSSEEDNSGSSSAKVERTEEDTFRADGNRESIKRSKDEDKIGLAELDSSWVDEVIASEEGLSTEKLGSKNRSKSGGESGCPFEAEAKRVEGSIRKVKAFLEKTFENNREAGKNVEISALKIGDAGFNMGRGTVSSATNVVMNHVRNLKGVAGATSKVVVGSVGPKDKNKLVGPIDNEKEIIDHYKSRALKDIKGMGFVGLAGEESNDKQVIGKNLWVSECDELKNQRLEENLPKYSILAGTSKVDFVTDDLDNIFQELEQWRKNKKSKRYGFLLKLQDQVLLKLEEKGIERLRSSN
ncbi:Nucleotide/sugar transporter family protein isoform 2 [Hibiscus syriacus]|uniref:Nucleotide/sugar transporter family protein isoform 2 n=1 Tax=Hibiscus syriacus TaxID=106335 RepID=A0A6A3D993_HIBSY|nr:Nucleotide/sugar transporter family protein isoform 2 [Hibiscus syriacus]